VTIQELASKAHEDSAELTIRQLFEVFELPPDLSTLEKVDLLKAQLEVWRFETHPDLNRGEITDLRRVCYKASPRMDLIAMLAEIEHGEGRRCEFKSSLAYDYRRAEAQPNLAPAELASDGVVDASLKSIAGFMNSAGGVLYLGVRNDGSICGLEPDFICCSRRADRQNADGWEQHLRSLVVGRFKDGNQVNDYIQCELNRTEEGTVARIEVFRRSHLTFVRMQNEFILFRRQGNQTTSVSIEHVEEFLALRGAL